MDKLNIFSHLPEFPQKEEIVEKIFEGAVTIERIVSTGQSTPKDFYYEQEKSEFVILLSGSATLDLNDKIIELRQGDYLNIPAMTKHRVLKTDAQTHTVWLAIHY
jgi:cupin 2 domain-containing protein